MLSHLTRISRRPVLRSCFKKKTATRCECFSSPTSSIRYLTFVWRVGGAFQSERLYCSRKYKRRAASSLLWKEKVIVSSYQAARDVRIAPGPNPFQAVQRAAHYWKEPVDALVRDRAKYGDIVRYQMGGHVVHLICHPDHNRAGVAHQQSQLSQIYAARFADAGNRRRLAAQQQRIVVDAAPPAATGFSPVVLRALVIEYSKRWNRDATTMAR